MSPLDDELRTALQRRADAVAPSPDPLAGVERRAGRLRRNRLAASVAASVLAVAGVATAVPLLTGSAPPDAPPVAVQPAPTRTPDDTSAAYALDPAAPWDYRGTPLPELGQGFLETATVEVAARHGVAEDAVTLTPLWGQVDEPSARSELVVLATVDGEARWSLVRSSEAGPEVVVDEPLPDPALALAAALPGDEVARLVVVAAPSVGSLQYGPDAAGEHVPMAELAPGVGITALDGDPVTATYSVLDPSGAELLRSEVPPVAAPPGREPAVPPTPANAVDWPLRGAVPPDAVRDAEAAVAEREGVPVDQVVSRPLFGAERDGRSYGLLQVWYGGDARVFAWVRDADGGTTSVLLPPTLPGPAVLAAQFDDVLVVVPEPRTGQVLYAPDGAGEPVPVPDQGTEAAVLVERAPGATDDRLLVLDGDGDPERPLYQGPVGQLLAGGSS